MDGWIDQQTEVVGVFRVYACSLMCIQKNLNLHFKKVSVPSKPKSRHNCARQTIVLFYKNSETSGPSIFLLT